MSCRCCRPHSAAPAANSDPPLADSKQTLLCTYLSAVLLAGLVLDSLFGWSWADPIAALVIAAIAVREGVDAWRGETCCAAPAARTAGGDCASCDRCDHPDG